MGIIKYLVLAKLLSIQNSHASFSRCDTLLRSALGSDQTMIWRSDFTADDPSVLTSVNNHLVAQSFGEFSDDKIKSPLISSLSLAEIVIVVHQEEFSAIKLGLQTETVRWLQGQSALKQVPRLILVSPLYSIRFDAFRAQATIIQVSLDGHFGLPINSDSLHFVGGQFQCCLVRAVGDAIEKCLSFASRKTVHVYLYQSLIYDADYNTLKESMQNSDFRLRIPCVLRQMAGKTSVLNNDSAPDFSEVTFVRQTDGKKVIFHLIK
jgi:hypothetical protein